jgi:hypothetical protein
MGRMPRRLALVYLSVLCTAAGDSSPGSTLIVGTRVELGALQGVPTNLGYNPDNGVIADLNGDGAPDIVVGINGSPPVVYLNNKTSTPFENVPGVFVSPPPTGTGIGAGAVVVVDANSDGHPDLAISGFNTENTIYLNNGTDDPFKGVSGISIGSQDTAYAPAFGDVNGDGFPDMAVANTNHVPSRLYLTNGAPLTSGKYSTVQIGPDLGYGQAIEIADVNGDGKLDLILAYITGSSTDPSGIAIYLNNGSGSPFDNVTPLRLLVGHSVGAIAVADLNGDGKPDLVASVTDTTPGDLYVYLNTASASSPFGNAQTLQPDGDTAGTCIAISVGDVNGDGLPDLLFGCNPPLPNTSPAIANPAVGAIYLNNGTANPFASVAPTDIPATSQSSFARGLAVGKLTTNGTADVLIVDIGLVVGGQPGAATYAQTKVDPNPAAQNDTAVVAIDNSVEIDALANDNASSGQSLNVSSVAITTAPAHGTATVDSTTGTITFQPTTAYSGTDSFKYTVRDNLGALSNNADVTVRIQPAPVAVNDTATVQGNQSATIEVLANDTSSGGTLDIRTVKIIVPPTHGSAVVTSGEVKYSPTTGYSGLDTFQYSVEDNLGTRSNVATVSIEVTAPPSSGGGGSADWFAIAGLIGLVGTRIGRAPPDAPDPVGAIEGRRNRLNLVVREGLEPSTSAL